jgi:TP901 family phage tail tape measure protein
MAFSMNLGNLEVHLVGDNSNFAKMMRSSESMMKRSEQNMKKIGKNLTKYVTAPLVAMAGVSVKAFADFDSAMTQSLAIMKNVTPQMRKQLEDTAKTISSKSVKSADELAKSYFFLASAGLDAEQSLTALPVVTSFATAGMFDMSLATDLLTDAQSALGLTVKDSVQNMKSMTRISDVLVKANTLANASVEQFSIALTTKAGTAMKSYNIEVEEGVAVLAAYADQGIKSQRAGTMFDRMLRLLIKSINDNRVAWDKYNIAVEDADGNLLPLADILEQVHDKTKDLGAIQKAAALDMLGFEARSQQAILPLLGLSDSIREYQKELENAGGITDKVTEKQLKAFSAQLKIVWNNVKIVAAAIGDILSPAILKVGEVIRSVAVWFRGLDDTTKKFIVGVSALAAAMGPLLLSMSMLTFLSRKLLTTIALYGAPILAITAIAVAVWAVVDAFTAADLGVVKFFRNIRIGGTKIGTWLDVLAANIAETFDYVTTKIAIFFTRFWEGAKEGGSLAFRFMVRIGKLISNVFWTVLTSATKAISEMQKKAAESLSRIRGVSQETINGLLNSAAEMTMIVKDEAAKDGKLLDNLLKESLDKSQTRAENYYAAVERLEAKHSAKMSESSLLKQGFFGEDGETDVGGTNATVDQMQATNEKINELLNQRTDIFEDNANKQIQMESNKNAVILSGTGALFGAMAQVLQSGGKKNFKLYKSLAMAEAAIATYMAYNKALASGPGPPATIPLAASVLLLGLAKVHSISRMQPGGSVSSGSTGGVSATPTTATPPEELTNNEEDERMRGGTTIIIENIHGTADDEFADKLAESLMKRSIDGRDFGFATVTR